MFKRFRRYNKWKDLYAIKEPECYLTVCVVFAFAFLAVVIDFPLSLSQHSDTYIGLLQAFIGALFGLIGLSISGIAVIVSLFSAKEIKVIDYLGKPNPKKEKHTNNSNNAEAYSAFEKILTSFEFFAFICAITIFALLIIYVLLSSTLPFAPIGLIYLLGILGIAMIAYCTFYAVSLFGNCISLGLLKKKTDEIIDLEEENRKLKEEAKKTGK